MASCTKSGSVAGSESGRHCVAGGAGCGECDIVVKGDAKF